MVRLGLRAVDQVRRDQWNAHQRSHTPKGKWIKGTHRSLLKAPAKQTVPQFALLADVQHANKPIVRAFLLKEELQLSTTSRLRPRGHASQASRSADASAGSLEAFVKLARTIRRHRAGILAAILAAIRPGQR